ncbi:MAG: hypothetical protein MUF49_23305 [Oculatellaceae cyanobacterium Prado106]|jgi:hypothetical protein|nr:hypothetical protein [Oculatellaceae cyanobacterium Prado106]
MEPALTILLAIGSGIAGLATGAQLGFTGGSLIGSLLTSILLVDTGVRQGILTLEQAEALGQQIGQQIDESFPDFKSILKDWEVTEAEPENQGDELGANRFVRGIVRELQRRNSL